MRCGTFTFRLRDAFTLLDGLIVIATIALTIGVILPGLARGRRGCGPRSGCVNNLRQLGIGFRLWSNDNGERFPWSSTNSAEKILEPYLYCLMASNELNSPKILICPADSGRSRAAAFDETFSNNNLSYFFGLDADETKPQTILAGDRNISTNNTMLSGLVQLQPGTTIGWAPGLHSPVGNIALGDGSSQQVSPTSIRAQMERGQLQPPTRLLIP
jgi:hypothetical protein